MREWQLKIEVKHGNQSAQPADGLVNELEKLNSRLVETLNNIIDTYNLITSVN